LLVVGAAREDHPNIFIDTHVHPWRGNRQGVIGKWMEWSQSSINNEQRSNCTGRFGCKVEMMYSIVKVSLGGDRIIY
jgi:hypothetical protein